MYKLLLFITGAFLSLNIHAQAVFKTPSGAKYHLATCRSVKNVSEEKLIYKALETAGPELMTNAYASNILTLLFA